MQLTVIGCSPAWPNPGGANSGYLVESDGCGRLLLDCGPGVLSRLRATDRAEVDAIAITHLHLDHWGDLVPWVWFIAYSSPLRARPVVWLPPGGRSQLESFAAQFGRPGMWQAAFDVREYEPEAPAEAAGFTISAIRMLHYGTDAFGFRVADRAGRLLAYSGDAAPSPELDRLGSGADLFLCEATLADGIEEPPPQGHLTAQHAVSYAQGSRLVLTHRPEELGPPASVEQAVEGLVLDV